MYIPQERVTTSQEFIKMHLAKQHHGFVAIACGDFEELEMMLALTTFLSPIIEAQNNELRIIINALALKENANWIKLV